MSWDATFYIRDDNDERHAMGDWNYTHNTNSMVNAALEQALQDIPADADGLHWPPWWLYLRDKERLSWWRELQDMSGTAGVWFLGEIIRAMRADPEKFRAMNPTNGWGDYDSLLETLDQMYTTSGQFAGGEWVTSG